MRVRHIGIQARAVIFELKTGPKMNTCSNTYSFVISLVGPHYYEILATYLLHLLLQDKTPCTS